MSIPDKKYFLTQDNNCHWYVVPTEKRKQWNEWLELDSENPDSWEAPLYAEIVGGSPSNIVFENYEFG